MLIAGSAHCLLCSVIFLRGWIFREFLILIELRLISMPLDPGKGSIDKY